MASSIADADIYVYDGDELEDVEEGIAEEFDGEEEGEEEEDEEEDEEDDDDEEYVPPGDVAAQFEAVNANADPPVVILDSRDAEAEFPRRQRGEGAEASQSAGDGALDAVEEPENGQRYVGTGGGESGTGDVDGDGLGGSVHSDTDVSIPNCPICMERWTCQGVHRVCCIPCGHVYGRSCLESWVQRCGNNFAKCPQCKRRFKIKDIINLYAPQIIVVNDDLEKEVSTLRQKNELLNMERKKLLEEVRKLKDDMGEDVTKLKKPCLRQSISGATNMRSSNFMNESQFHHGRVFSVSGLSFASQHSAQGAYISSAFVLQDELELDGARVLDIDASSQILLISGGGNSCGWRGGHVVTKVSLLRPCQMQNVQLPDDTGTVRDLHFAPANAVLPGRLALLASLGKKLSIFSMESNNVVLKYNLPVPSWSCSWDASFPYHIYAGLQDGMLLLFDVRQTAMPLELRAGLSRHPVHTIHSLAPNELCGARSLLTASSVGPCMWDVGSNKTSPLLLPETQNQGVCISLACGSSGGDIVASFRPRVETAGDVAVSLSSQMMSPSVSGPRLGTHVFLKRAEGNIFQKQDVTSGNVSEVRMSRSAIMCMEGGNPLFVYGDEAYHGLCIWDLTSFRVLYHLKPHEHPILDIKYTNSMGSGLLCCISENRLQVFRVVES